MGGLGRNCAGEIPPLQGPREGDSEELAPGQATVCSGSQDIPSILWRHLPTVREPGFCGPTAQGDEGAHIGKRLWPSATQALSLPAMPSDPSQLARAVTWLGGHAISIVVSWRRKRVRKGQGGVCLQQRRGRLEAEVQASLTCLSLEVSDPLPGLGGDRTDHKYTLP